MTFVVLNNPALADEQDIDSVRILVHVDAVPENLARGWDVVGPCTDRYRDPLLSDDEQSAVDKAAAAARAALLPETPAGLAADGKHEPAAGDDADGTAQDQE